MGIVGTLLLTFSPAIIVVLFRRRVVVFQKIGKFLFVWYVMLFAIPTFQIIAAASSAYARVHARPRISPIFPPAVQRWGDDIIQWSDAYDLDPNLIATVMTIESCGDPTATSSAGATGIFQVMPMHFADWEMMYHPEVNAYRGLTYLHDRLAAANGNVESALAQYNGGPAAANPNRRANETKRYVAYGLLIYQDAQAGKQFSQTMLDWWDSYGSTLCQNALESPVTARDYCVVDSTSNATITAPYLAVYSLTQHLHGCADGAPGVDFASRGNDPTVISPISGVVTGNYTDGAGNTTLVIENDQLKVVMLHGSWYAQVGDLIDQGQRVGNQGNYGYSFGAHTHLMVWDKLAQGWVNPLALMR